MKKHLNTIILATAITAFLAAPAFAGDELARILEEGVLKVGVEGTYPPITYHDDDGELTGFDVEIAKAIGEKLGVEVEFTEAEWDSLLASIDSGRIDTVINAVSVTDERQLKYDFTSPYVSLYRNVIVKGDNDAIQSLDDLSGTKVAENITTEYADRLEELGAEIIPIDTLQQAFDLVTTGRADFTLLEDIQFYPYLEEHPDADLKVAFTINDGVDDIDQFAIPFKKGEEELVDAVEGAINELKADGTLGAISEAYFATDVIDYDSIGGVAEEAAAEDEQDAITTKWGTQEEIDSVGTTAEIEVNGVSLHYLVAGEGKPVVLVHGNGGNHKVFYVEIQQLVDAGYQVYAIDSRGQGENEPEDEYHYRDLAEDTYQFITALGLDKPAYYGWSDGGIIGLELESAHPGTVSSLVISGTNLNPEGADPDVIAWITAENEENPSPLNDLMLTEPDITLEELEAIATPVLVLAGSEDVILRAHTELIAETLPNASLVIVDKEDHGSYIEGSEIAGNLVLGYLAVQGYRCMEHS